MKTCALVIGHKKYSPGAVNQATQLSEFDFNDELAQEIELYVSGVHIIRVYRRTYDLLPYDINLLNPDFIISLHCNAFNERATGTEVLYYHRSKQSRLMAQILLDNLCSALGLVSRGIKPKSVEERGGHLLKYTHAPCVIAEPFFIDNDRDLELAQGKQTELAKAYAKSIQTIAAQING